MDSTMYGSAVGAPIPGRRSTVRVVVVGDHGSGKSSLISAAASENFPESVSPVLPPTRLPADYYPDGVPVTIIDTASSLQEKAKLEEELKRADAVVLTYACDKPETLNRLQNFWIPELRRLKVKVPVIVVGCKLDLRDEQYTMSLEQTMAPIIQQFREIETCIECRVFCSQPCAVKKRKEGEENMERKEEKGEGKKIVSEVFYYAQKAVLHPTSPLFDHDSQTLKPRCARALKRIFILCDHDIDGALNDSELTEFQVKCFDAPLEPDEIVGVKRVVQEKVPEGVNDLGLTLTGFLFLQTLFIEKGSRETTWTVLFKFGYNDDIELWKENLPVPSKEAPDQSVELTSEALDFLMGIFSIFDSNNDGALQESEVDELYFYLTRKVGHPWDEDPYKNSVERNECGDIRLSGFLSQWALMTNLDPAKSLAYLIYIGYTNDPATALRVTRKRTLDVKKQQSDRHVFHCCVFGPKNAGKSALLTSFIGRPFQNTYALNGNYCYTVNAVDQLRGTKKTLILHEIQEDDVKEFLSSEESLATCDIAIFVYDGSDEYSLKRASELLMDVARRGEDTGYGMPCFFVGAKDDLDFYPLVIRDSQKICQELQIDSPIHISVKEREMNNIFRRIVNVAKRCYFSVPETKHGGNKKQYRFASGGSAVEAAQITVRVVVVGDRGTGKSSLIAAVASKNFPESVSPVLPPTHLPTDSYPDGVPVTIIDTPSSLEGKAKLEEELKGADAVVLTYACDKVETFHRLQDFWIPEVRRLKLDLRDENYPMSLEQVMAPIMQHFREIETCIECSAANLVQVPEVFYYAQKAVLHPTAPLFDNESETLKPRCERALRRIFFLCDHDMDSALNDSELNEFQLKCFNSPLQPDEIAGIKRTVQEKVPEGVNQFGLTLTGFLYLHTLFIEKGRIETTWKVLRKFGYNNEIELQKENLPVLSKKAPDQSVELTSEAVDFLMRIFSLFDSNKDGALHESEVDELFSTAPESPWDEAPYKNTVERTESGDIQLSAFLSQVNIKPCLY
ncbi:hypothetical protein LXL04_001063 [Taraxacum kok-saghyz]